METWENVYSRRDGRVLLWAALAAFVFEFLLLTAIAWHEHWLSHPQPGGLDSSKFVEAEMVQLPPPEAAKLRSAQPTVRAARAEAVLSKRPGEGKKADPEAPSSTVPEQNVTESSAPPLPPSHGPVAIATPRPRIPDYLKTQELKTHVVIEFLITAQGAVTPRLLSSSGNEELDQIALRTAQEWKFRPAEQNHQAVDAKVRLRIVFEVN